VEIGISYDRRHAPGPRAAPDIFELLRYRAAPALWMIDLGFAIRVDLIFWGEPASGMSR